jgi:outer membrane protein TolC
MNNKIYKILYLVFTFLLLNHLQLAAQIGPYLTLKQAIKGSISNSKQLKISTAKIDEATAALQEAKDSRLPNFKLSGNYLRLGFTNIDLKSANSGGAPAVNPSQAIYGNTNLSLPLYAGNKIQYGIESSKYLQQAATLDVQNDKEAIVFNATKAYVNLFKAQQSLAIVKEELTSSLSRDSSLSSLERNGIIARNDLLKSQLQTSNIELSMLEAENNLNLAMLNMNIMLGAPENTILQIESSFVDIVEDKKLFSEYHMLALQNRKDLQAIAFRKKAAATGIKLAKAEAYPVIALTGGYIAAYIPDVLTITSAVNIGLGVQYNLANIWKKNTKLMQAKARENQINASEEILNDVIKLQVSQDYQNYILSKKKIEVYEKAMLQASENYRITNNKYSNSLATMSDLLDANVSLLLTKLNIQAAKADAVLAYQKLLQTTGLSNY